MRVTSIDKLEDRLAPGDMIAFVTLGFTGLGTIVAVYKDDNDPYLWSIDVIWGHGCYEPYKTYAAYNGRRFAFNDKLIFPILVGGVSYPDPRKDPETREKLIAV